MKWTVFSNVILVLPSKRLTAKKTVGCRKSQGETYVFVRFIHAYLTLKALIDKELIYATLIFADGS